MAVEQSGAEASPGQPVPEADAPEAAQPDAAGDADFDDMKRRFREALERKKTAHGSTEGADHTGKVTGTHGPAHSRRSFRRKSG